MAGRIRDEDIAAIRERVNLADLVREFVTLKSAGTGTYKGLCPFHDERTPSFHVSPNKGTWYCFGCSEGGDAIAFLMKIEHVGFVDAVEQLADKAGITVQYVDRPGFSEESRGQRARLIAAHADAEAFYRGQLGSAESATGVQFLKARGFDRAAATRFGVGYAPKGWDSLTKHLKAKGHAEADLVLGGLAVKGDRGVYDKFRGRLIWPIRNAAGETIGFGARKLYDDDPGPKYLNTSETPIYKKSQVLYGLDLARRDIAKTKSAIVVEGYTDVMACHLAGLTTAVAACGTAFSGEHTSVLRRVLMDDDGTRGEVTFFFDGDAAGQKAALRAFNEDQRFLARTYVAVEPNGKDPCEVRQLSGDAGLLALMEHRTPLFEFAIKAALAGRDLSTPEGRVQALGLAAPVVAQIKDASLRPEYTRALAGWIGLDVPMVQQMVARASRGGKPAPVEVEPPEMETEQPIEREALKAVLQQPARVRDWYGAVEATSYERPVYRRIHAAIEAADPFVDRSEISWVEDVIARLDDPGVAAVVRALAVEPLAVGEKADWTTIIARLLDKSAERRIAEVRSRMQRAQAGDAAELFSELMSLESYRRELRGSLG